MNQGHTLKRLQPSDAGAFHDLRLIGLQLHPGFFGSSYHEEAERPLEWFEAKLSNSIVIGAQTTTLHLSGIIAAKRMQPAKQRHKGSVWEYSSGPNLKVAGWAVH
ncbi:hypothetical protein [Mesorhizobium sp. BH1-1-4]|uniref:hypothetical protein n=1 Tax=Mesorhizobium sp. BH1-1-4 TaxID=2876662 RepID=UPI001CD099C4|nr:hypothetical protein [Mesorhizobium sp. BH1-1-4]MBZ9994291.1 hypothetical protein [Mesorhizobium sp. BH1-1-4]